MSTGEVADLERAGQIQGYDLRAPTDSQGLPNVQVFQQNQNNKLIHFQIFPSIDKRTSSTEQYPLWDVSHVLQYQPRSASGTDKGTGLDFAAVVSPAPEHWDQYLQ